MSDDFNPYRDWFNIPSELQPPDHYTLLGLTRFESQVEKIDHASEQRAAFLQDVANGSFIHHSQQLLNEVAQARLCLLHRDRKKDYDQLLKRQLDHHPSTIQPAPDQMELQPQTQSRRNNLEPTADPQEINAANSRPANSSQLPTVAARRTARRKDRLAIDVESEKNKTKPPRTVAQKKQLNSPLSRNVLIGAAASLIFVTLLAAMIVLNNLGKESENPSRDTSQISETKFRKSSPTTSSTRADGKNNATSARTSTKNSQATFTQVNAKAKSAKQSGKQKSNKPAATELVGGIPQQGLVIWLDASDAKTVTTDSKKQVGKWTNKVPNQIVAVQSDAKSKPKLVAKSSNNKPAIKFADSNFLRIGHDSILDLGNTYTIVLVGTCNKGVLLSKGLPHKNEPGSFSLMNGVSRITFPDKVDIKPADDPAISKIRIAQADDKSIEWTIDGQAGGSYNKPHAIKHKGAMFLGCRAAPGNRQFATGEISELLIYNRPISYEERLKIEAELTKKWLQ